MLSLKVTTIGSSAGVILPKEALAYLKVRKGDTVYLTEAPDGSYRLTPYDPEFERTDVAGRGCHARGSGHPARLGEVTAWRWVGIGGGACDP